nr:MAG TPA: hypothetical protein [Caudoviricetes sp.]
MVSPKYGGKVSAPLRYLIKNTITAWKRCQIYVWKKQTFTQFTFPVCYI